MLLRDPVHGLISFESDDAAIVPLLLQTREVQRLRRIRQLGLTCLAFPGATHTRFAHALGAAHVMQHFVARLRKIHGGLPFWQRLTSERAREAIAAAFLHDLGHGPLSHLFEDALKHSQLLGGRAKPHEHYTEQILLDPSTDVGRVLRDTDSELPERVAALVRGEHELPYLARTVSGTFDVDRCDYLLRDAHATGVSYGEYDLPWLLRSLRFAETSGDEAPGLAIDGLKGLSAIESFVLARLFMFQQVYFHKSTRAGEWMIRSILIRALQLLRDGTRLPQMPKAMLAFATGREPTLGEYLELDDQMLLEAINQWRDAADPILSDLCERLRARALFKTEELFGSACDPSERARIDGLARQVAEDAGLEPDLYAGVDVAQDTPYSDDASLTVVMDEGGRARRPAEVSFVLDRLRDETLTRARLIFAPELRPAIRALLAKES